jgi:hypothetical protein
MTSTTAYNGRLCNQIIRNLAVSKIAEKNDLFVEYSSHEEMKKLGIDLFIGTQKYDKTVPLTDMNYFSIYNQNIRYNLNANNDYFQTKEIIQILHKHIQSVKNNIIENNPFKARYQKNNDVCLHIRLTDTEQFNPGAQYYLNTLARLNFEKLYITTDHTNHFIITQIIQKYPRAIFLKLNEVQTLQFASTCKYVVLSNGSFSAVIGYLSFFSTVYYCKTDPTNILYGDMFSIPGWKEVSLVPPPRTPFGKRFFFNT